MKTPIVSAVLVLLSAFQLHAQNPLPGIDYELTLISDMNGLASGNGSVYAKSAAGMDRPAAKAWASSLGTHLVTINDWAEQSGLAYWLPSGTSYWCGLSDALTEGVWVWDSGEPLTGFSYWVAGEPNNNNGAGGDEDFVKVGTGGLGGDWHDVDGTETSPWALAEYPATSLARAEYDPSTGKVFLFIDTPLTSFMASQVAGSFNGDRVAISGSAEQAFVASKMTPGKFYWTGGSNPAGSGLAWDNGEPTAFTNWAAGEPNAGATRVVMGPGGSWYTSVLINPNGEQAAAGLIVELPQFTAMQFDAKVNTENGHVYSFSATDMDRSNAAVWAANLRLHLVTISDVAEMNWLKAQLPSNKYWCGFSDAWNEGIWLWDSQEAVTYTNWNSGEPNNAGNEDYVQVESGGGWNDVNGSQTDARAVAEVPGGYLRSFYNQNNNQQYHFFDYRVSRAEALNVATSMGGMLIEVSDQAEQAFLAANAKAGEIYWTGGSAPTGSSPSWASGAPWGYTNWGSGQPSAAGSQLFLAATGIWVTGATSSTSGADVGAGIIVEMPATFRGSSNYGTSLRFNISTETVPPVYSSSQINVTAGQHLTMALTTPDGTYSNSTPLIIAQAFDSGSFPSGPVQFPEIHISTSPLHPYPAAILFNGATTSPLLPAFGIAGGITLPVQIPGGLAGSHAMLQTLVLAPAPGNPFFTATDAHVIHFQ